MKKQSSNEHLEQMKVFQWARNSYGLHPELRCLFAIPNAGRRSYGAAKYMQAEGLQSGVPDLCLPIFRDIFSALFIEMKYGKNKPTENQTAWIERLNEYGCKATVCYSAEEAIEVIRDYLNSDRPRLR